MSNTYSQAPFISHDGILDGVRAEVRVVTGYGLVEEVVASKAGKSFKVSFRVENTEHLPGGWAPDGSNIMDRIREAEAKGEPIHFRIETRRQKHVDRSLPMSEVAPPGDMKAAKDNIHKSLAAVKFEGDEEWTISPHAVTNMLEDPTRTSGAGPSANNMSVDQLNIPGGTTGGNTGGSRHKGFEPPAYEARMADGSIAPGSYAVAAPLNILAFVAEWDRDHAPEAQVGEKKHVTMTKAMLAAANELQLAIFDGALAKPDLGAASHVRARALVFEVTRNSFPLDATVVESRESLIAWKDAVVAKALAMWKWSLAEVEALNS